MKKVDILASLLIGVVSAILAIFILDFTEWQLPIVGSYPLSLLLVFPIGSLGMLFVAQILSKKGLVFLQIAKCFLAGVLNTFVDLGILNFFIWLFSDQFLAAREMIKVGGMEIDPLFSAFKALSFSVAAFNAYFWNKYWTFEKKETKPGAKEFAKLYVVTGIGFFLNVIIASVVFKTIGPQFGLTAKIWPTFSAGIATFIVFIWNFAGYKFIVFKK